MGPGAGIIGITKHIGEKQVIDFFNFARSLPNIEQVGDSNSVAQLRLWSVFIKEQAQQQQPLGYSSFEEQKSSSQMMGR